MTVSEAQNDLLSLIGLEDAAWATAAVKARILSDINATLQKLWSMAAPWWSTQKAGAFIYAPAAVAGLTLTKGSTAVTTPGSGTFPAWSQGCTVRLDGDTKDNEIVSRDATGTAAVLALPYAGASGSGKTATVYCDCLTLPETVSGVIPPVIVAGERELVALRNARDVAAFSPSTGHNRDFMAALGEPKDVDVPVGYLVERSPLTSGNKVLLRIRLAPLPGAEYSLQYEARGEAPRFASLTSDAAKVIPVPQDYADSIFMPLLRYQFSTWKHFEAAAIKGALKDQYQEAFQLLAKLKPQVARAGGVRVSGNW